MSQKETKSSAGRK